MYCVFQRTKRLSTFQKRICICAGTFLWTAVGIYSSNLAMKYLERKPRSHGEEKELQKTLFVPHWTDVLCPLFDHPSDASNLVLAARGCGKFGVACMALCGLYRLPKMLMEEVSFCTWFIKDSSTCCQLLRRSSIIPTVFVLSTTASVTLLFCTYYGVISSYNDIRELLKRSKDVSSSK